MVKRKGTGRVRGGAIKKADFWVRDEQEFGHGFFEPPLWRKLINKLKEVL